MSEADRAWLAEELGKTRKYAGLAPRTLERVAEGALRVSRSRREALKRAKRKLHQIHGAFWAPLDYGRIEGVVSELERDKVWRPAGSEEEERREVSLRFASAGILSLHTSSAERLAGMEEFYRALFSSAGLLDDGGEGKEGPQRILDLGCGLHPFGVPWMGLPPAAEYVAVDIDAPLMELVQRFLRVVGQPGRGVTEDVLEWSPRERFDVALLMKLLPTLERQERGAARRLLCSLDAPVMAVSFPRTSLGGRVHGMDSSYAALMRELCRACSLEEHERLMFDFEAVYVCRRRG